MINDAATAEYRAQVISQFAEYGADEEAVHYLIGWMEGRMSVLVPLCGKEETLAMIHREIDAEKVDRLSRDMGPPFNDPQFRDFIKRLAGERLLAVVDEVEDTNNYSRAPAMWRRRRRKSSRSA